MQVYVMWVYINVFIKINNLWKILFSKMKKYLTKPITFELFYDWNYLDKQYFFFFYFEWYTKNIENQHWMF